MKIWLRTANNIPTPMEMANGGVSVVFFHLYHAMRRLDLPVVLDNPGEPCIELWWGWGWSPRKTGNLLVALFLGETPFCDVPDWEQFDIVFLTTQFYLRQQPDIGKPMYLWRLGVDVSMFPVIVRGETPFVFSHMGSGYRKGTELACEAFSRAFNGAKGIVLQVRYPELSEPSVSLAKRWEGDNIHFIPQSYRREEMWKSYQAHCLVYPSLREGWGLCLTEALSTGMPAIASGLPVLRELYDDGCCWWLGLSGVGLGFGVPSVDDISQKMQYVYEHPLERVAKSKHAASYIRQNLFWEQGITTGFLAVMRSQGYL